MPEVRCNTLRSSDNWALGLLIFLCNSHNPKTTFPLQNFDCWTPKKNFFTMITIRMSLTQTTVHTYDTKVVFIPSLWTCFTFKMCTFLCFIIHQLNAFFKFIKILTSYFSLLSLVWRCIYLEKPLYLHSQHDSVWYRCVFQEIPCIWNKYQLGD